MSESAQTWGCAHKGKNNGNFSDKGGCYECASESFENKTLKVDHAATVAEMEDGLKKALLEKAWFKEKSEIFKESFMVISCDLGLDVHEKGIIVSAGPDQIEITIKDLLKERDELKARLDAATQALIVREQILSENVNCWELDSRLNPCTDA